jgi:glycogen synthase-like protein
MKSKKILYVSSEVLPYQAETEVSKLAFDLARALNTTGGQLRIFTPRYGDINERRHQLHEVIRLSGMNLVINDIDMPLIVKVASIQKERMQVYFIDNDEYFKLEESFDKDGELYADNDERCIFFAKGIVETVKKLNWSPDLIHIQGWLGALLPLYLQTYCKEDPIFQHTKVITCFLREPFTGSLDEGILEKIAFDEITPDQAPELKEPNSMNLIKLASRYSDGVTTLRGTLPEEAISYITSLGKPFLCEENIETTCKSYPQFYKEVMGK